MRHGYAERPVRPSQPLQPFTAKLNALSVGYRFALPLTGPVKLGTETAPRRSISTATQGASCPTCGKATTWLWH